VRESNEAMAQAQAADEDKKQFCKFVMQDNYTPFLFSFLLFLLELILIIVSWTGQGFAEPGSTKEG
jgi:hypothetical protein